MKNKLDGLIACTCNVNSRLIWAIQSREIKPICPPNLNIPLKSGNLPRPFNQTVWLLLWWAQSSDIKVRLPFAQSKVDCSSQFKGRRGKIIFKLSHTKVPDAYKLDNLIIQQIGLLLPPH